jgi:hypothetical protein
VFIVGESVNYLEHAVLFIISFLANTFSSFSGGGAGAALRHLTDVTPPNDISVKIVGYADT